MLKLAVSSVAFHTETKPELIERYRQDLKFFARLRASAARRYAEEIDFRQYEGPIQKLLDTYVGAGEVETVVKPVDIFDRAAFKKEVDQLTSPESKAETIANRIRHTIHVHVDEDPVFYRKLGAMLKETYDRYEAERFGQLELLRRVEEILDQAQNRDRTDDAPPALTGRPIARTYYDIAGEELHATSPNGIPDDDIATLAVRIEEIIDRLKIIGWERNTDVQNRMRTAVEDELFDFQAKHGVKLPFDAIDRVLDRCIEVARRRSGRPCQRHRWKGSAP
jgi:type I restriction enzyme R subunit